MALLPLTKQKDCRRMIIDGIMARHEVTALTKPQLDAAIAAVDQWVDDNVASYNLAIPQPARSLLTAQQKVELLMAVTRARFEVS